MFGRIIYLIQNIGKGVLNEKIRIILFVIVVSILIPSAAFANELPPLYGAGEWDYLGEETVTLGNGTVTINDSSYWSGGGDYKIKISGANSANVITIFVYEDDPDGNNVMVMGKSINGNANGEYTFSTRDFVDGDNGKAELRFSLSGTLQPSDVVTFTFYD